jgi:leucyl-tRNA synthetase
MITQITQRLNALSTNTVVSGFMEYTTKMIDLAKEQGGIDKSCIDTLLILLAPFTPHLAEELWSQMGHKGSVFSAKWPEADKSKLVVDEITIPLQINGKFRENIVVDADSDKETIINKAKEALATRLEGKTIVKEIYVPKKIVNIVIK